jgi:hypothetical protein
MTALVAGDLTLNQVLTKLGYKVVRHRERSNGIRARSVRKDGKVVRFPEGTIPGWPGSKSLERTTASIVWKYLRATGQITGPVCMTPRVNY